MNPTENTVGALLARGRECLSGIESRALDAEVLLAHVSGLSRLELIISPAKPLESGVICEYHRCLELRRRMMPVAYIIKSAEFMSLEFYVDERVLIPRPDTEVLVERALELISRRGANSALELCTGSGCIAVALAHYRKALRVTAVDISAPALEVARENALRHGVDGRVTFLPGDMFAPVSGRFDILLANPPYIRTPDIAALGDNVRVYESASALDGGEDGLKFYRRIRREAGRVLNPGGVVALEIGYDQGSQVCGIFGGCETEIIKDLSGHDRVVIAKGADIGV